MNTNTPHIIQNPEQRYTVAYEINANGNELVSLKYSVAHTAPRDNYSRRLGRTIATGRLKSTKPENVSVIPLVGVVPTSGKEWQSLENGLKTIVETNHRRALSRRDGE